MKIAVGSDHGAYERKQTLIDHLKKCGYEVEDFGCHSAESCDYPDFGSAVARAVADGEYERGIVLCTTGIGISITANKIKGIRCALCTYVEQARLTREHNDANVLAIAAKYTDEELANEMADVFLNTEFSNAERHLRRINKIKELEE